MRSTASTLAPRILQDIHFCRHTRLPLRASVISKWIQSRGEASTPLKDRAVEDLTYEELRRASKAAPQEEKINLRSHLKKLRKESKKKLAAQNNAVNAEKKEMLAARTQRWRLTVGIEIHAELNTACKLFSPAPAADVDGEGVANSRVALFDAAMPGTQPQFQVATLLPAIRAALALGCTIQPKSSWDRKHYFHWDQPNGYQITQYYEPFAKDGTLTLTAEDGVPIGDLQGAQSIQIGIKQIQMEQDTAKTIHHPPSTYHIDLNRAGHPLIEIITLPQIHSPQTAAAVVRKIQSILKSVDACVAGMEVGGLRADVNVSVRESGTIGLSSYGGVVGLSTRTEIKNLSSFKAVEEAIIAERDRQIGILQEGGEIEGETRGWTLGATETTRLRGKEGEVDYRYMPDPELPPLLIGEDLVKHLQRDLPELADSLVQRMQDTNGMSVKDAKTIVSLDDGARVEYLAEIIQQLGDLARKQVNEHKRAPENFLPHGFMNEGSDEVTVPLEVRRMAGNWVLHEIGALLTTTSSTWADWHVSPREVAEIIFYLHQDKILGSVAKKMLARMHELPHAPAGEHRATVEQILTEDELWVQHLTDEEYTVLAQNIMNESPHMVEKARAMGHETKLQWFVGQMMRRGAKGAVNPKKALATMQRLIPGHSVLLREKAAKRWEEKLKEREIEEQGMEELLGNQDKPEEKAKYESLRETPQKGHDQVSTGRQAGSGRPFDKSSHSRRHSYSDKSGHVPMDDPVAFTGRVETSGPTETSGQVDRSRRYPEDNRYAIENHNRFRDRPKGPAKRYDHRAGNSEAGERAEMNFNEAGDQSRRPYNRAGSDGIRTPKWTPNDRIGPAEAVSPADRPYDKRQQAESGRQSRTSYGKAGNARPINQWKKPHDGPRNRWEGRGSEFKDYGRKWAGPKY